MARLVLLLITLSMLLVARPTSAYACLWNWQHGFAPIPACPIRDHPTLTRVKQLNLRISAKLLTIAAKVQEVKVEIEQWRAAYRTAQDFDDRLRQVWGAATANPLPSLIAAYNSTSMAGYLQLQGDGQFRISPTPVNFRQVADSIWESFQHTADLRRMYGETFRPSLNYTRAEVYGTADALEQQIIALGEYERYSQAVRDSLQALGNRTANRYAGRADLDGDAEARISNLSATLSRLRGTAFETQALSITARIEALEAATALHHQESKMATTRGTYLVAF